ncbi:MAG: MFS transporter [Gemmataceae bacterium]|nr:MFS transporter [Gemmataceae bacterium]
MATERSTTWRWGVCSLLLCATMLMYMDRLTLSVLAKRICDEYGFSNVQYGQLDTGLSYAFAAGALFFGFLVDRIGPRWLYPGVLIAWSGAGVATAYSESIGVWLLPDASGPDQTYLGFMLCRIALGFFESGHWPCALVTTQIILTRADRSLGNSILQSGAAVGSVVTPIIVLLLKTDEAGGWRPPFVAIGCIGMFWIVPWVLLIRREDVERKPVSADAASAPDATPKLWSADFCRMFAVVVAIVICINLTWQFFRVWLPKYLQEAHGYNEDQTAWFTSAYYIATDVGCIGVGFWVKGLISSGWGVHIARAVTFTACAGLVLLAVAVAFLPSADVAANGFFTPMSLVLLAMLLLVAAGTLGLYPNYYSFTQELTRTHQGKISGVLGTIAWIGSGTMQPIVGSYVDATGKYDRAVALAGVLPVVAVIALWVLWPKRSAPPV